MEKNEKYLAVVLQLRCSLFTMSQDHEELRNAVSMLPFAYLTWTPVNFGLRFAITVLWMSSFTYHIALYIGWLAMARNLFALDVISQILNLMVLCQSTRLYSPHVKSVFLTYCSLCIVAIVYIHYVARMRHKKYIHSITISTHIGNIVLAMRYAKRRSAVFQSALFLCLSGRAFILHELGLRYAWAVGHVFCFFYTWFCWKALGVIATMKSA
jgi:hypothetical protein